MVQGRKLFHFESRFFNYCFTQVVFFARINKPSIVWEVRQCHRCLQIYRDGKVRMLVADRGGVHELTRFDCESDGDERRDSESRPSVFLPNAATFHFVYISNLLAHTTLRQLPSVARRETFRTFFIFKGARLHQKQAQATNNDGQSSPLNFHGTGLRWFVEEWNCGWAKRWGLLIWYASDVGWTATNDGGMKIQLTSSVSGRHSCRLPRKIWDICDIAARDKTARFRADFYHGRPKAV